MGFSARIITSFAAKLTAALDLSTPEASLEPRYAFAWADGAGAGQANKVFSDSRPVVASATDSIDLAGVLTSPLGGTLTLASVKEIFIKAADDNVGNLRVGKGVTNGFVGPFGASAVGVLIPPGGIFHVRNPSAAGWTVAAGTADLLPVENLDATTTNNFDIILIGT